MGIVCATSLLTKVERRIFPCFPVEDMLTVHKTAVPIKSKESAKFGLVVFTRAVLLFLAMK